MPSYMIMEKLDILVERINDDLVYQRNGDYYFDDHCCVGIDFKHYSITVWCSNKYKGVEIYNNKYPDRQYPRLEEWFAKNVMDYKEIDVEPPYNYWDEHGFSSETDYLRWRYG